MSNDTGIYQLENGYWGYRISIMIDNKKKNIRRTRDELGNPIKTKRQARKEREQTLLKLKGVIPEEKNTRKKTFEEVFNEYCEKGRLGKAYSTIRKQDSLWQNHLRSKFGKKHIDDFTVAEITDYLNSLYFKEGYSYQYTESFLRMFYLIFGQAYSRGYLDVNTYNKYCVNKNTKIRMPSKRLEDDKDIVVYSREEISKLDEYFKGRNTETAYMIGKYTGVRINECFGLTWNDIDFEKRLISINRQMAKENGVFKLTALKTRNAYRSIYMSDPLHDYLSVLHNTIKSNSTNYADARSQREIRFICSDGSTVSSLDLVNTTLEGKLITIHSFKYHVQQIDELLDIHFKYHYLRHTFGTRMAEQNTPTYILCNQMGHSKIETTKMYYLGFTDNIADIIINNMNNI